MRRKAGKNVTVKNRSIRAWLTAVTVTLCAVLSLPAVPAYADQFSHTYHTKVETTVQVTVRDADGNRTETEEVKSSGDFIDGDYGDDAVQAEIAGIDGEIRARFSSRGTVAEENRSYSLEFDHFESPNIIKDDDDGDGGVNKDMKIREYQICRIIYDLTVRETGQPADAVTAAGSGAEEPSDRTGSSPFLWFALLFVIGVGALTVYGIAGKRKKPAPSDTGKTE